MAAPAQHRGTAAACILGAISLAALQDAIVKDVSGTLPAYEVILFRTSVALPFLLAWLVYSGDAVILFASHKRLLLCRSLILCAAYFSFVLSLATLPIATCVSIYFTMPFFVAGLSGYALGERVPLYRWIAIVVGFAGVLLSLRPTLGTLQPAVGLALFSAFGYAVGQMMGRKLSHHVPPVVVANWQNTIYLLVGAVLAIAMATLGDMNSADKSMAFLLRPWIWPNFHQLSFLVLMGFMSIGAMVLFIFAYTKGEANFVAPFEYTAIFWAMFNGITFFGDVPDIWNVVGTAIVIGAGLYMVWNDRRRAHTTG
jgi:drug/metabolite transporter (DMT)-like permease